MTIIWYLCWPRDLYTSFSLFVFFFKIYPFVIVFLLVLNNPQIPDVFLRFQDNIYLQTHHKVYNMYKNCTKTFQWRNKATILDNVTVCPLTPGMRSHPQEWELERCTTSSQWPKTWKILFRYMKHNISYYNGVRSRHDPTVFPESNT